MSHSIQAKRDPGGAVVEVKGDVDAGAAGDLGATIASTIDDQEGSALVVIDLAGANMLDSRAMGVLAEWQTRLRVAGGRLAIVGVRPEVRRLFTMIGLEETFEFFPTLEAARASEPPA